MAILFGFRHARSWWLGFRLGFWGWRWLDVVVLLWVDLPEETVVLSDAALLVNDTFLVAPVYERGELFNAFVRVHLPAAVVLCFEPD